MIAIIRRPLIGLLGLAALAALVSIVRLLVVRDLAGDLLIGWPDLEGVDRLRLTSVAVAAIVGAALAVSGVLLQALLRNPLASPFILGVSGGAALGVMVAIYLGYVLAMPALRHGMNGVPAVVGAALTLAVVYGLGQRRGLLDPISLILTGVIVSAICGALIMFLQQLVPLGLRADLITWMAGTISQGVSGTALAVTGGITIAAAVGAMAMGRAMDAATLGDDEARSVGLALGPLRLALFFLAGVLAAVAVALAGPIGFVGLIAPHATRFLIGPRHRALVLGSALMGVALLVGADVASQLVSVGGGRMPVGIFTALIGGPSFIWLLRSGRGQA